MSPVKSKVLTGHIAGGVVPPVMAVVVIAELLPAAGSIETDDEIDAVLLNTVPLTTLELTLTVKVSKTEPIMNEGFVQVIFPVPPTAGVVQVKPNLVAGDNETKVVFAGTEVENTVLTP